MIKLLFLFFTCIAAWSADPARVYIYAPKLRGIRPNPIFCDGVQVASLRHKWSYFILRVPAGEHSFGGRHKGNELVLDVAAGQDYYLRLADAGIGVGEKLVRATTEEGKLQMSSGKLKPIEPDDVVDRSRVSFQ